MSNPDFSRLRRIALPLFVFALSLVVHYVWFTLTGNTTASGAESGCQSCSSTSCSSTPSVFDQYIATQSYWLGYSIALPLAFAASAIRQNFESRSRAAKGAAFGGISLSALLGFAGCYLTGCCGSPMLAVYVGLLGTAFLPFAKPLVAFITTVSILGSVWLLQRSASNQACAITAAGCCGPDKKC